MGSLASTLKEQPQTASTSSERRLQSEWDLLLQLAKLNPTRLPGPAKIASGFSITLLDTPALASGSTRAEHRLRIVNPRFFPSLPLEVYLAETVVHPNVHPITGFVCLWDRHRISNNVEHVLHKTVAILGWQLVNPEARHVMQPAALTLNAKATAEHLQVQPLLGVEHPAGLSPRPQQALRRRLS